jgi:hypothetical protein
LALLHHPKRNDKVAAVFLLLSQDAVGPAAGTMRNNLK